MNELASLPEFERLLANYELSPAAKQTLDRLKLVLLVGPSSSGRNTIINELLKSGTYHYIVSDTTRQPRSNNGVMEQNGREYWFRPEAAVLADIKNGQFLEAAVIHGQQVSGISMRELTAAADEGKIAINEIEIVGAAHIQHSKPDALFLFIVPPSFDEWMARMDGRGQLPALEVTRRLTSAVNEITSALAQDYYHFIVNDTFVHTASRVQQLVLSGEHSPAAQAEGRQIATQLLAETQQYLARL